MPLTDRDRRTLIVGGAILGALLLGFFIFNALAGGGTEEAFPAPPPITVGPSGGPGEPTGSPPVEPPPVFTGRDPFSIPPALVPSTPTTGPTTSGPTTSGPTTTGPTTNPPTTTTPPPNGGGPTTPGGGSSTVKGGKTIVLLDVFSRGGSPMAQVEVDGSVYNVRVGETFAGGTFRLRSVSGNCATFLYGDEPFTLCANATK